MFVHVRRYRDNLCITVRGEMVLEEANPLTSSVKIVRRALGDGRSGKRRTVVHRSQSGGVPCAGSGTVLLVRAGAGTKAAICVRGALCQHYLIRL